MFAGKLGKTEYRLDDIPAVSIAVITDFHNGNAERVLSVLKSDPPDIIAISGDLINGIPPEGGSLVMEISRNAEDLLRGCVSICPTYISLGNHEYLLCDEDLEMIRNTGAVLLNDEWTWADIPKCTRRIVIGGLSAHKYVRYSRYSEFCRMRAESGTESSPISGTEPATYYAAPHAPISGASHHSSYPENASRRYPVRQKERELYMSFSSENSGWLEEFEAQDAFRILLCHHPEYWYRKRPWLFRRHVDLVIAGHAHGGQIRIAGRGMYAPGQGVLPYFTGGIHEGPHGRLIISRGATNSAWPVPRLGNPCEIVYIKGESI